MEKHCLSTPSGGEREIYGQGRKDAWARRSLTAEVVLWVGSQDDSKRRERVGHWQDIEDRFCDRGRKPVEEHLPDLLLDIICIIDPCTQTDPTFRTTQISTPLSAKETLKRLTATGYRKSQLPCVSAPFATSSIPWDLS
ncbi:MAG: hypothetical protein R3F19_32915 [Verrucomicrobiales bacterium]